MILQIVQGVALGPAVGIIEQTSEEGIPVLPVDELDRLLYGASVTGGSRMECTAGRRSPATDPSSPNDEVAVALGAGPPQPKVSPSLPAHIGRSSHKLSPRREARRP
jgi:hypothetical protein